MRALDKCMGKFQTCSSSEMYRCIQIMLTFNIPLYVEASWNCSGRVLFYAVALGIAVEFAPERAIASIANMLKSWNASKLH